MDHSSLCILEAGQAKDLNCMKDVCKIQQCKIYKTDLGI